MKAQFEIDTELYATQGQRFVNFLIDYICQLIIFFVVIFSYSVAAALFGLPEIPDLERLGTLGEYVLGLILLLVYYNLFEIFFSRTIAKYITKTIVVDEFDNKPTVNAILTRSISRAIPLEFISFLTTPCKGWHDSLSDTYVVQKDLLDEARRRYYSFKEIGETEHQ